MQEAIKDLIEALESDLYGMAPHLRGLRKTLIRLDVKSAHSLQGLSFGEPLIMGSLEAILNNVTFKI